jgi:hypothetical protein
MIRQDFATPATFDPPGRAIKPARTGADFAVFHAAFRGVEFRGSKCTSRMHLHHRDWVFSTAEHLAMYSFAAPITSEPGSCHEGPFGMPKHRRRFYTREEDFLYACRDAAYKAAEFLDGSWHPNPSCDAKVRKQTEQLFAHGELKALIFDCAFIEEDEHNSWSVQIHLKSSARKVVVRVQQLDDSLIADKFVDRALT